MVNNLVLILTKTGNIRMGNIILYIPKNGKKISEIPGNTFYEIFNTGTPSCDGQFRFLSVLGRWLSQVEYENEKLYSFGRIQSDSNANALHNGTERANVLCIDWYLVTTYYENGIQVYQTREYVGTTCYGCDDPTIMSLCPDDSNSGSEGNCDIPDLITGTTVVSETISTQVSDIDDFTKHKDPVWRILRNVTWSLYSHETGIIKLVDVANNKWQWESLFHSGISMAGMPVGGTVSFNNGIGTPSFTPGTPNILYAGMSVSFSVTYAPVCNCPGVNLFLPPTTIPYVANAIWDAKPF
jgi:hypothetical protein